MDRKKTILIAVLINAGLLVLLFVLALHHEESGPKNVEMAQAQTQDNKPLFNDAPLLTDAAAPAADAPLAVAPSLASPDTVSSEMVMAVPEAPSAPTEVVYQLPPVASSSDTVDAAPMSPVAAAPAVSAPRTCEVRVKKGDSLEKIAKAHRTTVDEIIRINQLPSTFLRIGQTLKLPAERSSHVSARSKDQMTHTSSDHHPEYYTVKVGDNPWTIAKKHHMEVGKLLQVNHMNEEQARRLKPGDRLRIR